MRPERFAGARSAGRASLYLILELCLKAEESLESVSSRVVM